MTKQEIISALEKRYAVKTFDGSKKVNDEDLKTILESGRLAPSSFGLEAWKFIVVTNPEIREKMSAAGYGQTKITDASALIVLTYRTDSDKLATELIDRTAAAHSKTKEELVELQKMVEGTLGSKQGNDKEVWLKAQTYIALGVMIETAALLDIDTCPMEGFNPEQINTILGLKEKNLSAATILAIGYRGDDAYATMPKVRRTYNEVVEIIS